MLKKILVLIFMIYGMHVTSRAEVVEDARNSSDTIVNFPRDTYICGPSVVLSLGLNDLLIFMSPTYEGCRDIHDIWDKDLKDTQVIIEPLKASQENFIRIRPSFEMAPETYDYLCVDIKAYDEKESSKLYAFDYYIYK